MAYKGLNALGSFSIGSFKRRIICMIKNRSAFYRLDKSALVVREQKYGTLKVKLHDQAMLE